MAIIYSYPKQTTPNDSDSFVITDSSQSAPNKNRTKSLTAGDLASYVITSQSAITGSGTLNTMPIFTGPNAIGDSFMTYNPSSEFFTISKRLSVSSDLVVNGRGAFQGLYLRADCPLEVLGVLQDGNSSPGTAGQVLSSTGTGVEWVAGDTNTTYDLTGTVTGGSDYKVVLTGSDGTVDNVTFEAGAGITITDQGSNTVQLQAVNNGTVTGTGTTNFLPLWSDGPNGVLGTSTISQVFGGGNTDVLISTSGAVNPLNVSFGTGGAVSFKQGTTEFIKLTDAQDGFYTGQFRYKGKLTVDRDGNSGNPSLDVGDTNHTYPAAWFRNGVVVSNNPSGVTVDNTSMVIGSGNNDVVSGADNCLAVGNNNQILSDADNSLAVGQGNIIRNNADNSFAIGQNNVIDGTGAAQSVKSQVLGYQNSLTGSFSSFIAGGQNTVTTSQNAVALGFSHTLSGDDSMFAFGENNTGPSGASDNNSFMIGGNLTGVDGNMVLGFRNDTSSYPATDYSNGLGNTKFVVSVGTVTTSNAMIITEGGVTRGGGTTQVPRIVMPTIVGFDYSSDADAASNGIPIGGIYHNNGQLYVRLT